MFPQLVPAAGRHDVHLLPGPSLCTVPPVWGQTPVPQRGRTTRLPGLLTQCQQPRSAGGALGNLARTPTSWRKMWSLRRGTALRAVTQQCEEARLPSGVPVQKMLEARHPIPLHHRPAPLTREHLVLVPGRPASWDTIPPRCSIAREDWKISQNTGSHCLAKTHRFPRPLGHTVGQGLHRNTQRGSSKPALISPNAKPPRAPSKA